MCKTSQIGFEALIDYLYLTIRLRMIDSTYLTWSGLAGLILAKKSSSRQGHYQIQLSVAPHAIGSSQKIAMNFFAM